MTTSLTTSGPLFERNDNLRTITALAPFHEAIATALEKAAGIGRVSSPEENTQLTEVLVYVETVMKLAEEARTQAKRPVLEFGRNIDAFFEHLVADVYHERIRLRTLGGNYQTLLDQRRRAEEALAKKERDEIERRKNEELAKAKTHDEVDAIQARAHQEVQAIPQPIAPVRAHRQTVTAEIDFDVFDIDALNAAYPGCVKMEPKRNEIKALLKAGVDLPGVRKMEGVKVGVRLPTRKTIDV